MSNVAIITDSTATIPEEYLLKFPIHVAPQVLIWDNVTYRDGIDICADEFYARLKISKTLPTTSQATPKTFQEMFEQQLEQGHDILAILISEKLSGTIASAVLARDAFPRARIEIVDSHSAAMAMGFQVLAAAQAARDGATLADCKAIAEQARQHTGVIFAVDTLEFLHRGGRIGGASRFLGTALNIKPILEISGGRVEPVERVRTRAKSIQRMVELVEERIGGRQPVRLAALHANAQKEALDLLQTCNERFKSSENVFTEVSPVIGTNTGPGTVGMAYMAGM
jgi:DegV family protein with EDD domain